MQKWYQSIWRCGPVKPGILTPFDWAWDLFVPLKERDFCVETAFENGAVATFSEKVVGHSLYFAKVLSAKHLLQPIFKKTKWMLAVIVGQMVNNHKRCWHTVLFTTWPYKHRERYTTKQFPYTVLHMPEGILDNQLLKMGQDHLEISHLLSELAHPKPLSPWLGKPIWNFQRSKWDRKGKLRIDWDARRWPSAPADPIVDAYLPENQTMSVQTRRFLLPS